MEKGLSIGQTVMLCYKRCLYMCEKVDEFPNGDLSSEGNVM